MDSDPTSFIPESQGAQRAVEEFVARNERAKNELRQLVSTGSAFLLVGAGSSNRVGYPLWGGFLLDFFGSLTPQEQAAVGEAFPGRTIQEAVAVLPLKFASALEQASKDRHLHAFRQFIHTTFGKQTLPSEEHLALLKLSFRGVLTPNYDLSLERTLDNKLGILREDSIPSRCMDLIEDRNELFRFLHPPAVYDPQTRLVLHLHGVFNRPAHCIITEDDYGRAYPPEVPTEVPDDGSGFPLWFLNSLAGMHRIVFIGFSYNDPFISKTVRRCCENLWLDGKPAHFLIDGICSENRHQQMRFAQELIGHGVQLVCFDEQPGAFTYFPDAITFLGGEIGAKIESAATPAVDPAKVAKDFAQQDEKFLD